MLIEKLRDLPVVAVCNKSDLQQQLDIAELRGFFPHLVEISARDHTGVEALSSAVSDLLSLHDAEASSAMLANLRQFSCAQRAFDLLQETLQTLEMGYTLDAIDVALESAISALLELTGERVSDAVVDQVFSHFCVGK